MAERVQFSLTLPPGWLALTPETVAAVAASAASAAVAASAAASAGASASAVATTADTAAAPADATGSSDAPNAANGTVATRAATPELAAELNSALEQAARQQRPGRLRYVYLGVTGTASVHAWAHLELTARDGATPQGVLARLQADAPERTSATDGGSTTDWRDPAAGGVRPWRREVAEAVLAGMPAVVVDDLLEVPSAAGARLHRRILVTLFPDDPDAVVQFQLSTPDLTAFDDALAAAVDLVGSLRLTTPSQEPA
ncbi:hypothetical protein [Herbiconiux ginsengi]|uniref:Uncharacterized protein n=1 Tax=Herbiconiux ginsengi TaxID=381665 RepID=A0A1H3KQI2_9MICO|nr:hypothetical protein [Herbiconiux ginsengi]SDY54393.1 hypothetical protein SAMN05216554_0654 [Herbiconiux ginsengi]